ncbi:MAG: putative nucleic acid-binding protein [Oleiphilaceae bacterium]|jgi:predicted nucleic acid-binding protein
MPQSKILVDTNTYLRLAQTVRPLLYAPFGEDNYCLYIIPELNDELANRRLNSKFPWVNDDEYKENRKHFPSISRQQKKSIPDTLEYIWAAVQESYPGPSKVDALYVAYAIELRVPVVTDDGDLALLAKAFDVKVMPTLEVLKVMFDCGHIDMTKIDGAVAYWRHIGDRPSNLELDYARFFGG